MSNITHSDVYLQDGPSSPSNFIGFSIIALLIIFIGVYAFSNRHKIFNYNGHGRDAIELNDILSITSNEAFIKTV